ncbi:hypothetical protein BSL78_25006 [Apostichopus japonicus]|uniref:Uncharacterized protein n=1 Tax=Stichopus japonicus TaxID=307972 RepID=A0A2G8JQV8_STIJA|nr:hypothetical protein BSL78_25006 [Apostichopus japonicus]
MMRNDLSKKADVHDLPDHTVTVTSVTDIDLNPEGQHLGLNEVEYESEPEEEEEEEEEDDFGFPKNFEEASKRVMKKKEEPPEENEEEAASSYQEQKIFDRQRKVKQKMRQKKRKTPSAIRGKKGKKVATSRKHSITTLKITFDQRKSQTLNWYPWETVRLISVTCELLGNSYNVYQKQLM